MRVFTHPNDESQYEEDSWGCPPKVVPNVVFKMRVFDSGQEGPNPYKWSHVSSMDLFANKTVVIFSLPGAFTPTCSTYQLPGFEENFNAFQLRGIDEIYCISVNDAFVMNAWAKAQNISNVKMIPDGSAEFTRAMNMEVQKDNLGFGARSWRYAAVVNNGWITHLFVERDKTDNAGEDPYEYTAPEYILEKL